MTNESQETPDKRADSSGRFNSGEERRQITATELNEILREHKKWLRTNKQEGSQADLSKTEFPKELLQDSRYWFDDANMLNLKRAELQFAKLNEAQLERADLAGAKLDNCELENAELGKTNLFLASLRNADLRWARLEGALLENASLQEADLWGAKLEAATLADANFEGANLGYADLESNEHADGDDDRKSLKPTIMDGAKLRGARLNNAKMATVSGLSANSLGGADCLNARLPPDIARFDGLNQVAEISKHARGIFLATLGACLYSWLTFATTTDAALLTNTESTPLPIIQTRVPLEGFYWFAPAILLALYFYLHLYLQSLWEALANLPAVFPSGEALHERAYPWLLSSMVLSYVSLLRGGKRVRQGWKFVIKRDRRPTLWWLRVGLSILLAWLLVPLTLLGYWGRHLPRHDVGGTIWIGMFVVASVVGSVAFFRRCKATLRDGSAVAVREPLTRLWPETATAAVTLLLLVGLGAVAIGGIARFDALVFRTYADLRSADLSQLPADWFNRSYKEQQSYLGVTPARLEGANLRLALAQDAFLVQADLQNADLRGADLTKANLSGARLFGADLRAAVVSTHQLKQALGDATTRLPDGVELPATWSTAKPGN